jgi:glycosyltransferase involved in cell wall biosynthesis
MGIAFSEAMACGLPAVCYRLASYDVFGNAITKVEVGNMETMANKIFDLLINESKQKSFGRQSQRGNKLSGLG